MCMPSHRMMVFALALIVVLGINLCDVASEPHTNGCDTTDPNAPVDADLVLRGGMLHRGDGQPGQPGDLAIKEGRIVAVGQFSVGRVTLVLDCQNLIVCPGFIDLHNHSDEQVVQKPTRALVNYLMQGCTTIVTGNCGSGPIDVCAYYDQIDAHGAGVHVAHLLPQGSLRRKVVGSERREASASELDEMKQLTEQAMRDGAWGMSSGLIYVPSSYATTDELVELAAIVGKAGGIYASHTRNENTELLEALDEALEIGRRARVPVHISHLKSSGKNAWGLVRVAVHRIEQAQSAGQRVTADQYPYTASSTSLEATLVPPWARLGGSERMLARLNDDQDGPVIRQAMRQKLEELDGGERLQLAEYGVRPEWVGQRVSQISRANSIEAMEVILEILRSGGAAVVNHSIDEGDMRIVMAQPWVATASDGRAHLPSASVPHPRSYGTFPRKIGAYAIRENVVSLEQAIRSATGLPADILGLEDRGYLRVGYWADIVVFDPKRFIDAATFEQPHAYSQGVQYVFVSGQPAVFHGVPTGCLAGRALRSCRHARNQ